MKKLLPLFLVIAFAGCGKSDDLSPVITLISPTDHQTFTATQMVNVKATITDNEGIHMLHLTVLDNTTNGHLVFIPKNILMRKLIILIIVFSPRPAADIPLKLMRKIIIKQSTDYAFCFV